MKLSSLIIVRKKRFELFWSVHTTGFALYFTLIIIHGLRDGAMISWKFVIGPLAVYILDLLLRFYRDKGSRLVVPRTNVTQKGDSMVCIRLPRTFPYLAGQYCELKLPSLSRFEWHPFTIASSPHESEMLFFVKKSGDWTTKLHDMAGAEKADAPTYLDIFVRGPFGAPAQHVGQYEHVVLISGGVGATPFASITKYAHHWIENYAPRQLPNQACVSAAFSRNVSTVNVSLPNTPPTRTPDVSRTPSGRGAFSRGASSGLSRNLSSRNLSSRNLSRSLSRNLSRSGSRGRPDSRPLSRPASRSSSGSILFHKSELNPSDSIAQTMFGDRSMQNPSRSLDSLGRGVADRSSFTHNASKSSDAIGRPLLSTDRLDSVGKTISDQRPKTSFSDFTQVESSLSLRQNISEQRPRSTGHSIADLFSMASSDGGQRNSGHIGSGLSPLLNVDRDRVPSAIIESPVRYGTLYSPTAPPDPFAPSPPSSQQPQSDLFDPASLSDSALPTDFVEELGNPDEPIPDRFVEDIGKAGIGIVRYADDNTNTGILREKLLSDDSDSSLGDPDAPIPNRFAVDDHVARKDTNNGIFRDRLLSDDSDSSLGDPNGPIPNRFVGQDHGAQKDTNTGILHDRLLSDDSDSSLGDPNAPIPNRFVGHAWDASTDGFLPNGRPMVEVVREYDSEHSLFSDDDETVAVGEEQKVDNVSGYLEWKEQQKSAGSAEYHRASARQLSTDSNLDNSDSSKPKIQGRTPSTFELAQKVWDKRTGSKPDLLQNDMARKEEVPARPKSKRSSKPAKKRSKASSRSTAVPSSSLAGLEELTLDFDDFDLEAGAAQLEDEILREQQTASGDYGLLGISYGSAALLRYLQGVEFGQPRGSQIRATMNVMDEARTKASWQERLMFYLHSVTVNWMLLWIMILRLVLIGVASIVEPGSGHVFSSKAFAMVDFSLTLTLLLPVATATIVEILTHGLKAYVVDDAGNLFEMLVLIPLLIGSAILTGFLSLSRADIPHIFEVVVYLVWALTALLLLWRTGRTIGSRISLAQNFKSTHSQTKSLDFVWVSKTHADDQWLIDELLPLAGSGIVRLHRFITREEEQTEQWTLDYEKVPLKTTYKRPDWDDVFSSLVERSRSGSVIGVFFCGGDGMARAIQKSAMKAMAASVQNALKRGYIAKAAKNDDEDLSTVFIAGGNTPQQSMSDLHKSRSKGSFSGNMLTRVVSSGKMMVKGLGSTKKFITDRKDGGADAEIAVNKEAEFGCNVRISVRVENFT